MPEDSERPFMGAPEHGLGHEFDIEKYQGLVTPLKQRELVKGSEDIYEEDIDGNSRYEWTMDHHFDPDDFFAGIPQEALEDASFWAAVLSDGQMRERLRVLYDDERTKYIAFMPEEVRRNPKFSHLIIDAFNFEAVFAHMKAYPEETAKYYETWSKNFPDIAFLYEQYSKTDPLL